MYVYGSYIVGEIAAVARAQKRADQEDGSEDLDERVY